MQPKRITILGVGLLGGSIGLAVHQRIKGCKIIGYGHRRSTLDSALKMGALDEAYDQLAPAVQDADLIVLCTPVGLFRPILTELAPLLGPQSTVTDVGSTKRSVVSAANDLFPHPTHFVASHPMAGSEKRGVEFARADLYDNALCIVTPTPETDSASLHFVEDFWITLGMRIRRISAVEHDRRLADVSHLPHALAAALVAMQEEQSVTLAGKGYQDMTRIAGGDGALWRDILLDNRDNVRQSILRLKAEMDALLGLLDPEKSEELRQWLDEVAKKRQK